jgi:eukaryotic-like serine/threonine-protein kinase
MEPRGTDQGNPPRKGDLVAGRYRLVCELGRGGMGSVWRAENLTIEAACAIKLMLPEIGNTAELRHRFLREARLVGRLRSPYIVTVFDAGEWDAGLYIAMELLDGETLAARLDREGTLDLTTTNAIVAQLAQGLEVAHGQGVIHRDLKPENVFLARGEPPIVKILDFGVAKYLGTTSGPKTSHGALFGTVHYMSPEQARGEPSIDHRSDIWALGIVTYQCLTGTLPFSGNTVAEILGSILHRDAAALPVPGLAEFWRRSSRKDPAARFQSARELAEALRRGLAEHAAAALPHGPSSRHDVHLAHRFTRGGVVWLALVVLLVLGAGSWGIVALSGRTAALSPAREAPGPIAQTERQPDEVPSAVRAPQPASAASEVRDSGARAPIAELPESTPVAPPRPRPRDTMPRLSTPRAAEPPSNELQRYDERIGF